MKRLVAGLAFLSSLAAFLVAVGGGLALLAIESSGVRGAGALLALCGTIAFAAAMLLLFAREGAFAGAGAAWAIVAALVGVLPVAALSVGALRFSGFPIQSAVPAVDWPVFALGVALALGAVSVLAMGYWRGRESPPERSVRSIARAAEPPAPVPLRSVDQPSWPAAREAASHSIEGQQRPRLRPVLPAYDDDDDIRVTPVDLPSIRRFRQQ